MSDYQREILELLVGWLRAEVRKDNPQEPTTFADAVQAAIAQIDTLTARVAELEDAKVSVTTDSKIIAACEAALATAHNDALEMAAEVVRTEPELPDLVPNSYNNFTREEIALAAVQCTKDCIERRILALKQEVRG